MADHNLECQEFWKQESVDAIIVDKIVCKAVDTAYVEELDDNYIGYGAQNIKSILEHLRTEWCVITMLKKKQAAAAFHVHLINDDRCILLCSAAYLLLTAPDRSW
jgi:hypothetical protein